MDTILKCPQSSFIKGITYTPAEKMLLVEMNNASYIYLDVPSEVILEWTSDINRGESVGSYYSTNIKGKFKGMRSNI